MRWCVTACCCRATRNGSWSWRGAAGAEIETLETSPWSEEDNGEVVNYWVEMGPIPSMIRRGIGYRTFQPGDVITLNLYPLIDGRPGGNYSTIEAADGETYGGLSLLQSPPAHRLPASHAYSRRPS